MKVAIGLSFGLAILNIYIACEQAKVGPLFDKGQFSIVLETMSYEDPPMTVYADKQQHSQQTQQRNTFLFGCEDLEQMEVIRVLGEGLKKRVYEVKLPSGVRAVAKRCIHEECHRKELLQKEALHLDGLQQKYGREATIAYFGKCDAAYYIPEFEELETGELRHKNRNRMKKNSKYIEKYNTNFTQGFTYFSEIGKPLLVDWDPLHGYSFRECFASYFTDADAEDFRIIARQYAAGYGEGPPVLLGKPWRTTDNIWAQQYMIAKAGIRHSDLDHLHQSEKYTHEEALEYNCDIVRRVLFREDFNCSVEYSAENPPSESGKHIDLDEAHLKCKDQLEVSPPTAKK